MSSNLNEIIQSLSLKELLEAREKIEERIQRARRSEQTAAKKKILELARDYGIDVAFQESGSTTKASKLPPKYKNPENPNQTWPGHGKKPAWLEKLLTNGYSLDQLLITAEKRA